MNEQLYPFSPYYRRLFDAQRIDPHAVRRVADLRSLPLTTKTDIAPTIDDPLRHLDLVLQPDADSIRRFGAKSMVLELLLARLMHGEANAKERVRLEYAPVHATFTTGRTALPTQFLYASADFERLHVVGKRLVDVQGALPGERGLNVFPFAPHLAFWQVFAVGQAATMLFMHTGGGKVMGTPGNITALERMQPEMLMGVPGYVYHLLRKAAERGVRLDKLKRIALGAERVPPALKVRLGELCEQMGRPSVSVQGVYGFTEARMAWAECPAPDHETSYGYHTYPDLEVFETVDPDTGESVGEGQRGELVYTTLGGRGSCVLRYRTGDIVEGGIVCEPCPGCGRVVPRICGALSRRSDIGEFQLTKIRGTLVDLNEFLPVMAAIEEVVEWQLVVKKHNDDPQDLDELLLYIALREGVEERPVASRISRDLLQRVEVAPNRIEVMPLAQLETSLGLDTQLKETRIRDIRNLVAGA
ncbi:MAG: phenylacetate--CoA ligase [Candidatus Eremiobacter antarcticus]|nr:MAG: phenylacetate--CoA ligase [Candidatus Eremiobacter sp. RRmetagenome_bin22]